MASVNSPFSDALSVNFENNALGLNMYNFHYHDGYEVYLLTGGVRRLVINDIIYMTRKNDIALIPPGSFHKSAGDGGYSGICISIPNGYLEHFYTKETAMRLLKCFDTPIVSADNKMAAHIENFAKSITENCSTGYICMGVILEILNALASKKSVDARISISEDMSPIMRYIKDNYTSIKSLDDIANALYITKGHACNIFKKETGMTMTYYINSLRIQLACHKLLYTSLKIEEISEECGFESASYFNKVFKKFMNYSPREFRQRSAKAGLY